MYNYNLEERKNLNNHARKILKYAQTRAVPDFGSGWNPTLFQIRQKSGSGKNFTGAG